MNLIVVNQDLTIDIIFLNPKKYGIKEGQILYSECKALKRYSNPSWFVTDQSIDKSDLESRRQLYVEEGSTEIKKDLAWEKILMPDQLIKKKHLKAIQDEIDLEAAKQNPDVIKIVKKQSELRQAQNEPAGSKNESAFWAQKAIDGLARASKPKPQIAAKLAAKLQELTNG